MTLRLSFLFPAALITASFCFAAPEEGLVPFLENHCYDCHDTATKKGKLDLETFASDLKDPAAMALWVKVHDRLKSGEMPPKKKDTPPAEESSPFLEMLSKDLIAADQARATSEGRSVWRRLNREEYENSVRELLSAPWLDLREILPEDGEAHRFSKAGEALDISHIQMARYMQAADQALRSVIATSAVMPKTKVTRYYARDQAAMRDKIFYSEFNRSPDRSTFPLLGTTAQPDVISEKIPVTVGDKDPATRELEALGVTASSYEPIQPRFNNFRTPRDGVYKLRFMTQTFTAKAIVNEKQGSILPSRDETFPGKRNEPVSLYAINARTQRKIGDIEAKPETAVSELTTILRKGEIIGPDASRLYRSRPPGPFINPNATPEGVPGVAYRWMEVEGPIISQWPPAGHELLFGSIPINAPAKAKTLGMVTPNDVEADSRSLLSGFIAKAYRRPVSTADKERFLPVVKAALDTGSSFSDAMIAAYTSVLCSPGFLCLEEPVGKLDDYALASRLSYFLWNSPPDKALRELAANGKLAHSATLRAETNRMLDDPRSDLFISSFLGSWLDLRHVNLSSPDSILYPDYYLDDLLTESALEETRLFFTSLIKEDLPARNLIDSDFTFLNERLALHYSIPGVNGVAMRKTTIPENSPRGGLMTMASVLKVTANGTTTSPVIRGNWILERILGQTVPPPPPGTPAVEPDIRGAKTIRQQLAKHSEDPSCHSCHAKMDPPGFALESFDVFGGWRDSYRALEGKGAKVSGSGKNGQRFTFYKGLPVDSTGKLEDGSPFTDIISFKKLLLKDERLIAGNLANQLITYSTGTPVRFGDRPVLEKILNNTQEDGYGVRSLIHEIIQTELFRNK